MALKNYRLGDRILHAGNKLFVTGTAFPTNGLTHYWKFDESSGSAYDSVGTYTLSNNLFQFAAGKKNNCTYATDRNASYLRNSTTNMDYGSAGTFTMWLWFDNYASTGIIQFIDSNTGIDFEYYDYRIYFKVMNDAAYLIDTNTFQTGQWNFCGCSWNGTNRKIYYNDKIKTGTGTASSPLNGKLLVGNNNYYTSGIFNGKIDELGYWNRQLSDTEIGQLYNSGNGLFY